MFFKLICFIMILFCAGFLFKSFFDEMVESCQDDDECE